MKDTLTKPEAAWGGIGGSGRHAADVLAEVAQNPKVQEFLARKPEVAWGGIGGSGKHPELLEPEIKKG